MKEIINLINIIETKQFKHSFYKEFLLTENMQPSPQNNGNKMLIGGGLAVGAGLAANHMIQNNPALKQQLINNVKSTYGSAKNIVNTVGQTIHNQADKVKNVAEFHSHTHPNLNSSAEELNAHATYLKGLINNPAKWNALKPNEQDLASNAYNQLVPAITKLEKEGRSLTTYSKDLDPKLFDRISSATDRDAHERLAQGIEPGSIKDKITTGIQAATHIKDGFGHMKNQASDTISHGATAVKTLFTG